MNSLFILGGITFSLPVGIAGWIAGRADWRGRLSYWQRRAKAKPAPELRVQAVPTGADRARVVIDSPAGPAQIEHGRALEGADEAHRRGGQGGATQSQVQRPLRPALGAAEVRGGAGLADGGSSGHGQLHLAGGVAGSRGRGGAALPGAELSKGACQR